MLTTGRSCKKCWFRDALIFKGKPHQAEQHSFFFFFIFALSVLFRHTVEMPLYQTFYIACVFVFVTMPISPDTLFYTELCSPTLSHCSFLEMSLLQGWLFLWPRVFLSGTGDLPWMLSSHFISQFMMTISLSFLS